MKTTVVNKRFASFDVYIGRPTKWGNPFVIGLHGNRQQVIKRYENWIKSHPKLIREAKKELKGRVLGCFCKPYACHGDVLASIANS